MRTRDWRLLDSVKPFFSFHTFPLFSRRLPPASLLPRVWVPANTLRGPMATRRRPGPPGNCAICGTYVPQLSFEHVPPRSAYNKVRLDEYEWEDMIRHSQQRPLEPLTKVSRSGVRQGGAGWHRTCGGCNNFSGRMYVPAYADWVRQVFSFNISQTIKTLAVPFRLQPLNILKQVAFMFMVQNDGYGPGLADGMRRFILGEHVQDLPSRVRFYAFSYLGRRVKHGGLAARMTIGQSGGVMLSEIIMRPLGLLMTVNEGVHREGLTDITDWRRYRLDEQVERWLNLTNVAEIQPITPADYRTDEQVEKVIRENMEREAEEGSG